MASAMEQDTRTLLLTHHYCLSAGVELRQEGKIFLKRSTRVCVWHEDTTVLDDVLCMPASERTTMYISGVLDHVTK